MELHHTILPAAHVAFRLVVGLRAERVALEVATTTFLPMLVGGVAAMMAEEKLVVPLLLRSYRRSARSPSRGRVRTSTRLLVLLVLVVVVVGRGCGCCWRWRWWWCGCRRGARQ